MAPIQKFSLLAALLTLCLQVSSQGTQFITGPCVNDAACASGCCGFNSGKCAGAIIALERDGGCGFGDAQPNDRAAQILRGASPTKLPAAIVTPSAPSVNIKEPVEILPISNTAPALPSAPQGTQFITGVCTSDASCASKCCGFNSGKCAGPVIAQERDGGCGFGNVAPNNDAAPALPSTPPGAQFITGVCTSDASCASKCCGFNSGKCAGPIVAQERDGGCGFGNVTPNDDAAKALTGRRLTRDRRGRSVVL